MDPAGWSWRRRLLAGIGSGLALNLAFPPIEQGWVALVALVPLLVALRGATARAGFLASFGFGWAFFGILLAWISRFGFLAWGLLVGVLSLYVAAFGALAARAGRWGSWARLAAWPLLWAGVELARERAPFGGFPWGTLGSSQVTASTTPSVARLAGVSALGAFVLLVNGVAAEALGARGRARVWLVAFAAALVVGPVALPAGAAGPSDGEIDLAAVQGNVPPGRFSTLGRVGRVGPEDTQIIDNHLRLTERLVGTDPDLVVWAENAFDRDPYAFADLFAPVQDLARRLEAPMIVPAILDAGEGFRNANLLLDASGDIVDRYDKIRLVPFGEYVPLGFARDLVPVLAREVPSDGVPGSRVVVFDPEGLSVGTMICYESAYPQIARALAARGASVLVVTTNNASYGRSPAAEQHLAISRMRAIETGRPVAHVAISGISALIAADGTVLQRSSLFEPAILRARLPRTTGTTPATRYGAWVDGALAAGAAVAALGGLVRRRAGGGT